MRMSELSLMQDIPLWASATAAFGGAVGVDAAGRARAAASELDERIKVAFAQYAAATRRSM